eukprot:1778704-Rhodomonas_salina.1
MVVMLGFVDERVSFMDAMLTVGWSSTPTLGSTAGCIIQEQVATCSCLRVCYAVPGTGVAYGAMRYPALS